MKTSILIYATCIIAATGCSAQLRFPSLSSALSSLTGFGGSSNNANSGASSSASPSTGQSSPYSGLVRDYGRNLMMAMSSIYPTLFKPPQQSQAQAAPQAAPSSPFEQFAANSFGSGSSGLFSGQSSPSFSFGGSTFSISPSLPFGSFGSALGGSNGVGPPSGPLQQAPQQSQQQQQAGQSPFSGSFGSSINSPSSFGPLSSSPFFQSAGAGPSGAPSAGMPSFAPASSYNAAFEAANGPTSFGSLSSPSQQAFGNQPGASAPGPQLSPMLSPPSSNQAGLNYNSLSGFNSAGSSLSQHEQVALAGLTGPSSHQHSIGPGPSGSVVGSHQGAPSQSGSFSGAPSQNQQTFRPEMMSIAASAPMPSSSSYQSNFGNIPSAPASQQGPSSHSSYQQPSYRPIATPKIG